MDALCYLKILLGYCLAIIDTEGPTAEESLKVIGVVYKKNIHVGSRNARACILQKDAGKNLRRDLCIDEI